MTGKDWKTFTDALQILRFAQDDKAKGDNTKG